LYSSDHKEALARRLKKENSPERFEYDYYYGNTKTGLNILRKERVTNEVGNFGYHGELRTHLPFIRTHKQNFIERIKCGVKNVELRYPEDVQEALEYLKHV
jgi:hypothetical protein